jgi:2-amino-1-hydroxyethylphosphonate dioxygenase (glycine-forming)
MIRTKAYQFTDEIMMLFEEQGGHEYAGEKISQLEHMCQTAQLAIDEGQDDEVILAAFLHDIGHLLPQQDENESMNGFGMMDHEKMGAYYLSRLGFSEKVCRLIASHVAAKRYLTYKYPEYYSQLSEASKQTLEFQGGKMNEIEARAFEQDHYFQLYIQLRKWDEAAKIVGQPTPDLELYRKKITRHLLKQLA